VNTPTHNQMDITVIEATEILEDGSLVLGAGVGATPELSQMTDKIIIELNTHLPSYKGIHDIVRVVNQPHRKSNLIRRVDDRIGTISLPIDDEKVIAVVESTQPDRPPLKEPQHDIKYAQIADHLVEFFTNEIKHGRLPKTLLPIQSGVGNIANAIIGELAKGPFYGVSSWSEVMQDTFLDFIDEGKLKVASAGAVRFSPKGFERLYNNWNRYADKIILRPQSVSNNAEIINRLGVIAMNTPVEFDIYGHVNSTHISGTRALNGLGGSGDFIRHGSYSIVHCLSTRPTPQDPHGISCIVPMVSHTDQTEHDVGIFVTENGLADCRGMSPKERAIEIITKCAHPYYKDQLLDYYNSSVEICTKRKMLHIPHMLDRVFKMHINLEENGTMKIAKW